MATASETYEQQWKKRKLRETWDGFLSGVKMLLVVVLFIVGIFGVSGVVVGVLDSRSCNAQTAQIGFPHQWSFWGGCQIQVSEGKWIPLSNYYYTEHP